MPFTEPQLGAKGAIRPADALQMGAGSVFVVEDGISEIGVGHVGSP